MNLKGFTFDEQGGFSTYFLDGDFFGWKRNRKQKKAREDGKGFHRAVHKIAWPNQTVK
jgi:hypothetical protein